MSTPKTDIFRQTERQDNGTVNKLRRNGPPPYAGVGLAMKYAMYNNVLFDIMGSPSLEMVLLLVPQFAREYGLLDKVNFARGLVESFTVVYPQLHDLDFTTQAARLDLPVYFLVGCQDINAMASLVERYYNVLEAPHKELIWLESGHGASSEELLDAYGKSCAAAEQERGNIDISVNIYKCVQFNQLIKLKALLFQTRLKPITSRSGHVPAKFG